jgi:hypothetical protein
MAAGGTIGAGCWMARLRVAAATGNCPRMRSRARSARVIGRLRCRGGGASLPGDSNGAIREPGVTEWCRRPTRTSFEPGRGICEAIDASIKAVDAFVGVIDAFIGVIDAFIGVIDAFIGVIDAFIGVIDAFIGVIDAFIGVIDAIIGVIDAIIGVIDAIIGVIDAFIDRVDATAQPIRGIDQTFERKGHGKKQASEVTRLPIGIIQVPW